MRPCKSAEIPGGGDSGETDNEIQPIFADDEMECEEVCSGCGCVVCEAPDEGNEQIGE